MKMLRVTVASVVTLVLASFVCEPLLSATPLPGSLQIRLSTPAGSVTLTDQGGCAATGIGNCGVFTNDASDIEGTIITSGSFGAWTVNVTTGFGYPTSSQGMLELTSINMAAAPAAGTLTVQLTQTGFDLAVAQFNLAASGTIMGAGSSVAMIGSGGVNNSPFNTSNNLVAGGTFGSGPFSFDQDGTIGNSVNPYSLTATYQITGGTDSTDFTGNMLLQPASVVQPVTEPASILLLGAGLAGLALSKIGGRPLV